MHTPFVNKSTVRLENTDILNFFLRFRELLTDTDSSVPDQITEFLRGEWQYKLTLEDLSNQ